VTYSTVFRAGTITNPPPAASGSVTFDVPDAATLFTAGLATAYPAAARNNPVVRAKQGIDVNITSISGSTITATIVTSTTSLIEGGWILEQTPSVNPFYSEIVMTLTPAPYAGNLNKNLWSITFSTNAGSQYVRGHYLDTYIVPSAAGGSLDALAVYANHLGGNFSTTLRAIVAVTYQNLAGNTIASAKTVEAGPFCYGGTITEAVSFDAVNDIQAPGAITTYYGLRIRGPVGSAPGTMIAIAALAGQNRFVGNVIIGEDSAPIAPLYIRGTATATGGISAVARMEGNHTVSANGQNIHTLLVSGGTLAKGAFTGLFYSGMRVINPSVSGAGVIDIAVALAMEKPTIGTSNGYLSLDASDNTAEGAYSGRFPIYVAGSVNGIRYVSYHAA